MTNTERIRAAARWLVQVRFLGAWSVVTYCQTRADADMMLAYWRARSSWPYRIVAA